MPDIVRKPDAEAARPQLQRPPMFRIVMLNDDFTPMEFVIEILIRYFHKSEESANTLMLQIHTEGSAVCGIFPSGIAETKIHQVETASRSGGHPLRCIMEREPEA